MNSINTPVTGHPLSSPPQEDTRSQAEKLSSFFQQDERIAEERKKQISEEIKVTEQRMVANAADSLASTLLLTQHLLSSRSFQQEPSCQSPSIETLRLQVRSLQTQNDHLQQELEAERTKFKLERKQRQTEHLGQMRALEHTVAFLRKELEESKNETRATLARLQSRQSYQAHNVRLEEQEIAANARALEKEIATFEKEQLREEMQQEMPIQMAHAHFSGQMELWRQIRQISPHVRATILEHLSELVEPLERALRKGQGR